MLIKFDSDRLDKNLKIHLHFPSNIGVVLIVNRSILESPVTEDDFKEQLHELNHKINFVKEQSFRDARACVDVKDILEKLKIKVELIINILMSHKKL